jgi:hypothetical protein
VSLLSVAQAVAEEVGLPSPNAVIGNTSKQVKQLLRLINRSGRILAKKNWTILQKEHTFQTVNGTASYSLPSDFERFLGETAWDRTSYWKLRGPLTPAEWQVKKSALVASATLRSNFRVKADTRVNKFFLDPTPSSAVDMVFEYGSDLWVKDSGNTTGKTAYAVDTDIALISEELIELDVIWRALARKGFAYEEEKQEAEAHIDRAFAEDGGAQVIDFGAPSAALSERLNLPEGNFG